ncbi:MAG: hypothetical protein WCC38_14225 [Pseudonocardiaceae bacterium]
MSDRVSGKCARLAGEGWHTDDNSACTLLVVYEHSGTWAIYGLATAVV